MGRVRPASTTSEVLKKVLHPSAVGAGVGERSVRRVGGLGDPASEASLPPEFNNNCTYRFFKN